MIENSLIIMNDQNEENAKSIQGLSDKICGVANIIPPKNTPTTGVGTP